MTVEIILILEMLFALYLLKRADVLKSRSACVVSVLLLLGGFALRLLCMNYVTLDYIDFLSRWVAHFRQVGVVQGLAEPVGNYNIPYLYFLALFSLSSVSDLYLIKLLSIFFDVVLAYASMRLLGKLRDSAALKLACFFTVLLLPTVVLNGSLWGQCDSIYVSLALLSIWLALDDKPVESMLAMTLSFGFKLQAVFLMPVLAVLWMQRRYKPWHFLLFPLGYVVLVLPAVLCGRPFWDTLTLYFDQAGSVGTALNYNSPSVFALLGNVDDPQLAGYLGVAAAFVLVLAVLLICFVSRRHLSNRAVLAASLLLAVGIPFLLPHMHDRYFYAVDALSVVLAYSSPTYSPAPVLSQFASLLGYHAYLKMRYLLPMSYGSVALLIVIALALMMLLSELTAEQKRPASGRKKTRKKARKKA